MKERPYGFLAELYETENEIGDYIQELHTYLWRVVRVVDPAANGSLRALVDLAIEALEKEKMPLLDRLCEVLGWKGGTIHQAIAEVRRLKEQSR